MNPQTYLAHYTNHKKDTVKEIKRNGIKMSIVLVPSSFYIAQEMALYPDIPIDSIESKYMDGLYFIVEIRGDTSTGLSPLLLKKGMNGYGAQVYENSFLKNEDFMLVCKSDTILTAGYNFERSWGIGNADCFTISFSKKGAKFPIGKYQIVIRDLLPELGTIEIKLKSFKKYKGKLKG